MFHYSKICHHTSIKIQQQHGQLVLLGMILVNHFLLLHKVYTIFYSLNLEKKVVCVPQTAGVSYLRL